MQDRTEHFGTNDSQMSEVFERVFQPLIDKHSSQWQCSLRQNQHDHVYDGVRVPLKKLTKKEMEEARIKEKSCKKKQTESVSNHQTLL